MFINNNSIDIPQKKRSQWKNNIYSIDFIMYKL